MKSSLLLKTGIIGSILFALCCYTPILVLLLGAIGLSAWVSSLDVVLFPAMLAFFVLTTFAYWRKDKEESSS
ncbi:MAG: mercury resistance system transport protein MerF [Zetaproteobacteria bacterium]|nr:mercury resistance system transport protein MerF [Zetaproteobacteria bacterium]